MNFKKVIGVLCLTLVIISSFYVAVFAWRRHRRGWRGWFWGRPRVVQHVVHSDYDSLYSDVVENRRLIRNLQKRVKKLERRR